MSLEVTFGPMFSGKTTYLVEKLDKIITVKNNYSGKTLLLENENQIDMATAISGSGPGFVFNLIDCMEHSAVKLGFKKSVAKILVSQTFKGSIDLLSILSI